MVHAADIMDEIESFQSAMHDPRARMCYVRGQIEPRVVQSGMSQRPCKRKSDPGEAAVGPLESKAAAYVLELLF